MAENSTLQLLHCDHLILLVGTNPLPNLVVADYFLQNYPTLYKIWLLHSEKNNLQAGTDKQAKNLETLLRKRWHDKPISLQFPLEKISLTDVSDAATILREIEAKMLKGWRSDHSFHLNYTGGTKAMATHVYRRLQELQKSGRKQFSYLDANNFRLVVDDYGVAVPDLRKHVQIDFEELIALHGFQRINADKEINEMAAQQAYEKFVDIGGSPKMQPQEGNDFEAYVFLKVDEKSKNRQNSKTSVFHNWLIRNPNWQTKFQLDVVVLHGYHLTGISCTASSDKDSCKHRGFEVILRSRQIGGDESRSILITRSNRNQSKMLQEELAYETGGQENILVLGIDDLRKEDIYMNKIEKFVFD